METFTTAAGSIALVKSIVDLVKYARAKDTNGWATQLTVWAAGVGTVVLLRQSDVADTFMIGDVKLAAAKWGTVVLGGFGLGSTAMLVNDVKNAVDNTSSAKKPPLVP